MSREFLFARLVWQWKSLGRRSVSVFDILWCIYDWELGWVELVLETASQNECGSWVIGKCVIVLCSVVVELFLIIFLRSRRGVETWRRELFVGLNRKRLQRLWFRFERSSWMLHVKPLPPARSWLICCAFCKKLPHSYLCALSGIAFVYALPPRSALNKSGSIVPSACKAYRIRWLNSRSEEGRKILNNKGIAVFTIN